jgi:hypothetical protein
LLAPLKDMAFAEKGAFIAVMLRTLGQDQLALLEQRLLSLTFTTTTYIEEKWVAYPFNKRTDRDYRDDTRLGGAGYGRLADIMQDSGLRAPAISNPRARFYFTELGWLTVGRHVAAEARRLGHVVKIVRRKNPSQSQIVYNDKLQMAILQRRDDRAHDVEGL